MTLPLNELAKDIVQLPRDQRLELARMLLELDFPLRTTDVEHLWDEEIRDRVRAVDEGRAVGVVFDDFRQEMATRFK